ncbi:MAG: sulfatase [Planctomycetes bacterium]|nr:sulfatase [Planctomycetota bacterium]MCB9903533.1 sulfatase [Planctomycetota bacterium]
MRPPTDRISSTRRRAAILVLCGLFAACGEDRGVEEGAVRAATVAEREWRTGESRLVTRLEVPEGLAPWTYEAERQRLETRPEEEGGQRVVVLGSLVAKTLQIPLDPDQTEFNQVACKLLLRKHSSVSVDLLSKGRVLTRTPYSLVIGSNFPQEIRIDVPALRHIELKPDALVLRFAGGSRWARCWDIELHQRPWECLAEEIIGSRGRPVVDDTAREGAVLATDNPRSVELDVPARGRLSFHMAPAAGLTLPDHPLRLAVRVTGDGETVEHAWPVDVKGRKGASWQRAELDLSPLAGKRVRAEFRLLSDSQLVDYALLSTPTVYTPEARTRTVLFVTSDTHRADHVAGITGSVDVKTPALDALGARGVIFDDCYSSTNITVPSHVALLTAVSPRDTLVLDNMSAVSEEARTIAESFRDAGWATLAAVSGPQLQDAWSGLGQGFDAMACPASATWDGAETARRLEELAAEVPDRNLFVWLHLFDVHRPYDEDNGYLALYYPEGRDPYDPALPDPPFPRGAMTEEMTTLRDPSYMDANYKSEVTYTDAVLAHVFSIPRIGEGVIAVTADHGECLGEYAIWWDHAGLFPKNLHVPLLIAGPGVPVGHRVTGPVQHLDIGRTLLDLAGLRAVEFPGESMLRHVEHEPPRDTPRFALASEAKSASVEMGGWMCILQLGAWRVRGMDDPKPEHSVELYDLRPGGDPLRDVAHDNVERASRLRGLILAWLDQQAPTGWDRHDQANDAARIDQVAALGYTTTTTDGSAIWVDPACSCEYCELFGE